VLVENKTYTLCCGLKIYEDKKKFVKTTKIKDDTNLSDANPPPPFVPNQIFSSASWEKMSGLPGGRRHGPFAQKWP
jgi:hypothetical protein